VDRFQEVLNKLELELNNKTIVVGISTGIDSMVLLDLLLKIKNIKIIVAHVNHNKREQSKEEQSFIESFCNDKNIICRVKELHFESTNNFQSIARSKRYEFFYSLMDEFNASFLLTAHHANDDLETMLMRFIKGSSFKGFSGIDENSTFNGYHIYRPLLKISKEEIKEYAMNNNILYYSDVSNDEDDYLRNRIRHNIIPLIEKENPNIYQTIQEYKENIVSMNNVLFSIINEFYDLYLKKESGITSFKITDLTKYNRYLQKQILFDILKRFSQSIQQIEELLKQINNEKTLIIKHITDDYVMIKEYGYCRFGKLNDYSNVFLKITADGTYKINDDIIITINKNICNFKDKENNLCYNINNLPLIVRTRSNGDKIKRHNKLISLSDYLTNKKITHFKRNNLVLADESGVVLFILGLEV